jgi:regulator of protease activity HflC (stomatin/prohibitin superfamily)
MATISSFLFFRHLRSDPSFHVIHYRSGKLIRSGRGLSFWFVPMSASIAKVPCDDRDQPFLFRGRSADFQDVTAQGVVTFRVADPEKLASRIDLSVDLRSGGYMKTPIEQLSQLLTQLAQQLAEQYLAHTPIREILADGVDKVRECILAGLPKDSGLWAMGVEIVSVRVTGVSPTAELEKALQAPAREEIQQSSDEAVFSRRAMAVEKERAIQENELQNQIELAKREQLLITQRGQNELRRATEEAEARRVEAEGQALRKALQGKTDAERIRVVEGAKVEAEAERMKIYADMPTTVMAGLAAKELAGKLHTIEHLNVSPELLGPLFTNLVRASTDAMKKKAEA